MPAGVIKLRTPMHQEIEKALRASRYKRVDKGIRELINSHTANPSHSQQQIKIKCNRIVLEKFQWGDELRISLPNKNLRKQSKSQFKQKGVKENSMTKPRSPAKIHLPPSETEKEAQYKKISKPVSNVNNRWRIDDLKRASFETPILLPKCTCSTKDQKPPGMYFSS